MQWPCNTSADQVWKYDYMTSQLIDSNDGMCLSVNGPSTADGIQIVQLPCTASAGQHWTFSDGGQFTNANGKCLGGRN